MPGVFTHGNFDTWSPGYLMFIAALHNGISRLYETFGNGGADTVERTLHADEYARTWYKQNPPLPKAMWSQRNNNNYQQTGLLTSLHYFAANEQLFLRNFYLKSKRSILKAKTEGPAAYVFPADDPRPGAQADLLRVLQKQGVEISRATAPFTVHGAGEESPARPTTTTTAGRWGRCGGWAGSGRAGRARRTAQDEQDRPRTPQPTTPHLPRRQLHRPHGSALQPHRRRAARLPVLEPERSAADAVRRHRLDVRRAVQRAGGARRPT